LTWSVLAKRIGLSKDDLERQVFLLKSLLRRERIEIPKRQEYRAAKDELKRGLAALDSMQRSTPCS
jgi:hypothetical protein